MTEKHYFSKSRSTCPLSLDNTGSALKAYEPLTLFNLLISKKKKSKKNLCEGKYKILENL
jgi:hypothetical protein